MTIAHTLHGSGSWEVLEHRLEQEVCGLKSDDPFATITVLVGSNLLGAYLKRTIARSRPLLAVRFVTIRDIARALALPELVSRNRLPLPEPAELLLAKNAARACAGTYFSELSDKPGLARVFRATFNDLRDANIRSLDPENTSRKIEDFSRIYDSYLKSYGPRFFDNAELMPAAAGQASRFATVFGRERLIVYGFYDFTEVQWQLLRSLSRVVGLSVLMPIEPGNALKYAQPCAQEFERVLGVGLKVLDNPPKTERNLDQVRSGLFRAGARGQDADDDSLSIIAAPGVAREVSEIVREILRLARDGIAFHQIGIVMPAPDTYAPLLRDAFDRHGIPYYTTETEPLSQQPAGRSILTLLNLVPNGHSDFSRQRIMDWLTSTEIKFEDLVGERLRPEDLNRISCEAGIVKGREQWSTRLQDLKNHQPENETTIDHMSALLEQLFNDLETFPKSTSWSEMVQALKILSLKYLVLPQDLDLDQLFRPLSELDQIQDRADFETFTELAAHLMDGNSSTRGRFQESAVALVSLMPARGVRFKVLFVPGLVEKGFPTRLREDPILLDHERVAINAATPAGSRLPLKHLRGSEERLLLRLLSESAGERFILSFPRLDPTGSRELLPSRFLLEIVRCFSDGPPSYAALAGHRIYHRIPLNPLAQTSSRAPTLDALSLSEFDQVHLAIKQNEPAMAYLLENDDRFKRALELARQRWDMPVFTIYDGKIMGRSARDFLTQSLGLDDRELSATRLENYARCPFMFFVSRVLKLSATQEPWSLLELPGHIKGQIVHHALNRVYNRLYAEDLLPLNDKSLSKALNFLDQSLEKRFAVLRDSGLFAIEPVLDAARLNIREILSAYLQQQAGDNSGFRPWGFEVGFGSIERYDIDRRVSIEKPVTLNLDNGREVKFRGSIDHLMLSKNPPGFRVIDYKTGSPCKLKQRFEKGAGLQRTLYFMAAQEITGIRNLEHSSAELHYINSATGFTNRDIPGSEWSELSKGLTCVVGLIIQSMEQGGFYAAPVDEDICSYCDAEPACDTASRKLYNRLADDDADWCLLKARWDHE